MNTAIAERQEQAPAETTPIDGIGAAIQALITRPDLDVSKVRELFELQREVRRDEAFAAFNEAMNEAQAEMEPVRKDALNPQTRSKYASYAVLDAAIRPIYTRHGFSVSFNTDDCPLENHVRTVAEVARSGFSKLYHLDIPADGKGARGGDVMTKTHATVSAISYGKRTLQGMIWNIATTDRDDDGNAAAGNVTIDADQADTLKRKIMDADADLPKFLAFFRVEKIEDMPAGRYEEAYRRLTQKAARADKLKEPAKDGELL